MTQHVTLEGEDIAACPACDSYQLRERLDPSKTTDGCRYVCYDCNWTGDDYFRRPPRETATPGHGISTGHELITADPDDVEIRPADDDPDSSGLVRMCDRCGSRVAAKSLVDGECVSCRNRDDDFDPRKALLTDGGRERGAPATRLDEAAKQLRLAREDAPDVVAPNLARLERKVRAVRGRVDALDEDVDREVRADGGRDLGKLVEENLAAQRRQARALERIAQALETAVDGEESVLLADGGVEEMPGESLDAWAEDLSADDEREHIPEDADDDWCPGPEGLERGELPCLKCFVEATQEQRDAYNNHPDADGTVRLAEGDR